MAAILVLPSDLDVGKQRGRALTTRRLSQRLQSRAHCIHKPSHCPPCLIRECLLGNLASPPTTCSRRRGNMLLMTFCTKTLYLMIVVMLLGRADLTPFQLRFATCSLRLDALLPICSERSGLLCVVAGVYACASPAWSSYFSWHHGSAAR